MQIQRNCCKFVKQDLGLWSFYTEKIRFYTAFDSYFLFSPCLSCVNRTSYFEINNFEIINFKKNILKLYI